MKPCPTGDCDGHVEEPILCPWCSSEVDVPCGTPDGTEFTCYAEGCLEISHWTAFEGGSFKLVADEDEDEQ